MPATPPWPPQRGAIHFFGVMLGSRASSRQVNLLEVLVPPTPQHKLTPLQRRQVRDGRRQDNAEGEERAHEIYLVFEQVLPLKKTLE